MEKVEQIESAAVKFRDFRFCNCGYEESDPGQIVGPTVRDRYALYYVLTGGGTYTQGDRQYPVSRGEAFLVCPGMRVRLRADTEDPWSYLFVGFDGEQAEEYLNEMKLLGAKKPVFRVRNGFALKQIVTEMLKCNHPGLENEFALQGLFCRFFPFCAVKLPAAAAKRRRADGRIIISKKRSPISATITPTASTSPMCPNTSVSTAAICLRCFRSTLAFPRRNT